MPAKIKTLHNANGETMDFPPLLDAIGGKLGSPQNIIAWQTLAEQTTPADYPAGVKVIVKKDGKNFREMTGEQIGNGLGIVEELKTASEEARQILRSARIQADGKTAEVKAKFQNLMGHYLPASASLHGYNANATKKALALLQADATPATPPTGKPVPATKK